jgi:hypothetical protein
MTLSHSDLTRVARSIAACLPPSSGRASLARGSQSAGTWAYMKGDSHSCGPPLRLVVVGVRVVGLVMAEAPFHVLLPGVLVAAAVAAAVVGPTST